MTTTLQREETHADVGTAEGSTVEGTQLKEEEEAVSSCNCNCKGNRGRDNWEESQGIFLVGMETEEGEEGEEGKDSHSGG